jgi:hypothetical protein
MKLWNQWTGKHEGWVERRRRFQEMFAEKIAQVTGERMPEVVTVPERREGVSNRGEK